ncbi:Rieske (2Fe-2S) protein [Stutzerimonas nosocomialis]|uniref:Rieske (2Fe-2S) protein n=1 Tax=Stutzerimonas nosocomialis TaxID=1056496 RepID=A0A5R9QAL4_9GAMM|nr:Rieske 2Fe-2S domain-containing protein [Stutzerimonas nosocomialis]TLX60098.1 Rieske (2Fe-2S) protein [Stutzerimonas nosocomialis]TLX62169.1 Rieske (2Fe-2S) protein [Stutzerimonas nosocomialis]
MFVTLERLLNLDDDYRRVFDVAGHQLLLIVVEGQPRLIENRCPHQGAPLARATLSGTVLRCPRHGARFDVTTGRALDATCHALAVYPLAYDGDRIGVEV